MSLVFHVDHDRKLVLVRCYGVLNDQEVFDYQHAVWSRDDVAGYDELVDVTDVHEVELPSIHRVWDLATTAARMDHKSSSSRFAIVAPRDLFYGLGRMYQAYRALQRGSTKEVGVFRTRPEAFAFLGINDPPPLPAIHSLSDAEELTTEGDANR